MSKVSAAAIRAAIFLLMSTALAAEPDSAAKTVIGPANPNLYDGGNELLAGNYSEGVRLTLLGLRVATSIREEKIAHSNLCAGYLALRQLETALYHCDWVLERDDSYWRGYNNRALVYLAMGRQEDAAEDIRRGQALRPNSEKLKEVKGIYMDEVQPVADSITIDDRRKPPERSPSP